MSVEVGSGKWKISLGHTQRGLRVLAVAAKASKEVRKLVNRAMICSSCSGVVCDKRHDHVKKPSGEILQRTARSVGDFSLAGSFIWKQKRCRLYLSWIDSVMGNE
jgi:hypothetical protein